MANLFTAAIDPMALILHGRAYLIWVEKNHPHVPKVAEIREVLGTLSDEERRAVQASAATLAELSKNVQEALGARA
ncbi:MAG TPA: hypothetical protein VJZ76_06955 [Thermoanaerobaculia bacterium]|nr:hypothetical protein [Thermoanaerobaculia bacterium]